MSDYEKNAPAVAGTTAGAEGGNQGQSPNMQITTATAPRQEVLEECKTLVNGNDDRSNEENDVDTLRIDAALSFLHTTDAAHNERYTLDDIGGGYLLADFLSSSARPLIGKSRAWTHFDGRRWCDDLDGVCAERGAKALGQALSIYANELPKSDQKEWLKWVPRWAKRSNRVVYIHDARFVHPVRRSEFDRDPMLLNCLNGTLDLRTCHLRPHNPDDLLTQLAAVEFDENAVSPIWEKTLAEVIPDVETRDSLQRWCGYCLTGSTEQEKIAILYGQSSRNGKSTIAESIIGVLGDYAAAAAPAVISETARHDSRGPSEDIARLRGKRFVTIAEPSQKMVFNAALLKTLTGGDTISCRYLNENSFEYKPMFKIVVNTNYLPRISDFTLFRSGRIMVIPFEQRFVGAQQNAHLKARLAEPRVRSAILNWMVCGLQHYQRDGIRQSAKMVEALEKYEAVSDNVQRFIPEQLTSKPGNRVAIANLYDVYQSWCGENCVSAEPRTQFKDLLTSHGLRIGRARPSAGGGATSVLFDYAVIGETNQQQSM